MFFRLTRSALAARAFCLPAQAQIVTRTVTTTTSRATPVATAPCREFTRTITIGGHRETGYGTACRQPDGSWQTQNDEDDMPDVAPPQNTSTIQTIVEEEPLYAEPVYAQPIYAAPPPVFGIGIGAYRPWHDRYRGGDRWREEGRDRWHGHDRDHDRGHDEGRRWEGERDGRR